MAMNRTWWSIPLALCLAMAVPPGALAAGGPVPPVQNSYIGMPGSPYRYGAFPANGDTVVKEQKAGTGTAAPALRIHGRYGIPGVDYSGSMTGLSADGRTLILAQIPGGTPHTTQLLVLDTPQLTIRTRLRLPGWSTVDAISPDGRWLYLIHYPSSDITKYEVLAYDLPAHRLLPQPVVDPRDRDEAMTGIPINRVMGAGSRWAYTLYMRPSGVPFIHALDTVGRRAVCIDLPKLANLNVSNVHLALGSGGGLLDITVAGVRRALINTSTLALVTPVTTPSRSAPAPAHARPAAHKGAPRRSDGVPWGLFAGLLAALTEIGRPHV